MPVEEIRVPVKTPLNGVVLTADGRTIKAMYRQPTDYAPNGHINVVNAVGVNDLIRAQAIGVNIETREDAYALADALKELGDRLRG